MICLQGLPKFIHIKLIRIMTNAFCLLALKANWELLNILKGGTIGFKRSYRLNSLYVVKLRELGLQ